MQTFRRICAASWLVAALQLAGGGSRMFGQQPAVVDAAVLKNAGTPADQFPGSWLSYGKSQSETRYSPLKRIDASNVKRLGLDWTYVVGAGGYNQEGTPLVWNNTIYGITTWSVVYAVDARTGKQLWRWDPEVNQPTKGINANRGLALYNGKIFAPAHDGRLFALDAMTGKPVWETRVAYPQDGYYMTMAPRIAGGKVIVGVSGGDTVTRGFFDAYDAATGQRSWRFYTVPGDPSKPFENEAMRAAAKTWGGDFYTKGGGGAVWDGFAYDPDANLIYVGTGNAEPWTQKFRGAQNLDNLYTCSILAVDLTTGKLKWYFQTVPNDNWDFDSVQQLMLLDLQIGGRTRKVLTQASKNGFFYAIDRVNGQFISGYPFVKVNWAKGLDDSGRPMVNPEAYYDTNPVAVYPTGGGAHNWAPMSFNPATGLVYIPASYTSYTYQADDEFKKGSNGDVRASTEPRQIKAPAIGPTPPEGVRGGLQAWDPVKHTLVWRGDGGGGIGGGTVTTGGNLVFQTSNDGHLVAYSADKGEKLYEVRVGKSGAGPPVTYEIDGKQYVAFMAGTGRPAGVVGPNDAKVDNPPMLFVFSLDGKAEMPGVAPPPVPGGAPAAAR
ncbi:MAG TPA: PQQ-dependent dehydrogenase, methanol/ethanol family [Bryobacteraceae bacterium]